MVAIPPKPPTNTSHTTTTNTQRQAEHDQHSHLKSTRRWPIQATTGGFATIDPRHAGDTPQGSAYGSNSPQATNKDKPHHHDKHTKTCRRRPTPQRHQRHTTSHHSKPKPPHGDATAQPRNHAQVEHRAGIAKGAGISRPLARVPSLVHEGHLDAAHQRGDDVVEHGSQRRQGGEQNDVDDRDDGRVGDDARQAGVVQ